MNTKTELEKVKAVIKSKQEEKEKYEKKLSQLKNKEKKLKRMASIAERKKRNHRFIERRAILENFIEGASDKTNEEIKDILQKAFQKANTLFRFISSAYSLWECGYKMSPRFRDSYS